MSAVVLQSIVELQSRAQRHSFRGSAWTLEEVLSGIDKELFKLTPEQRDALEPVFWHSLCTEYDSRNLSAYLMNSSTRFSDSFHELHDLWLCDEMKHARGFMRIYSLLYGCSEADLEARLQTRRIDFSDVARFLTDEFTVALLLAYDEIVTTHVYHRSVDLYRSLGPPQMIRWIQRLKQDEIGHFVNLVDLIRSVHPQRIPEARSILSEILKTDLGMEGYEGTFVLDHACADFSLTVAELEDLCIGTLLRKLGAPRGTEYRPRQNDWTAADLLSGVRRDDIALRESDREAIREYMLSDLRGELDSRNLYRRILERHSRRPFSPEFLLFLEAWFEDEQNHASGFLRLLQVLFGDDPASMVAWHEDQLSDFSAIEEFLDDEFELCVLLAYDEFVTVQAYRADQFYAELGSPVLMEWIRRVRADEGLHFGNLLRLIRLRYPHRCLSESAALMKRIVRAGRSMASYAGTFVFDFHGSHFLVPDDEFDEAAPAVLARLTRSMAST